jgi:dihydroorotase/N-acyl-D-amino-acid deacylase
MELFVPPVALVDPSTQADVKAIQRSADIPLEGSIYFSWERSGNPARPCLPLLVQVDLPFLELEYGPMFPRYFHTWVISVFITILSGTSLKAEATRASYDIVITNGRIIDGTGSPWYSGDLGILNGKIAAIGYLADAQRRNTIDARGKVVAPGFIDMLGQSELTVLLDPRLPSKVFQGITTQITGEGGSVAPLNDACIRADREYYAHYHVTPDWRTLREYFARVQKQGLGMNLATFVGATQVRRIVLGDEDKQPTAEQLKEMRGLVRQAMRDGAVGVSTSLIYSPAPYAKTEELIALAAEASSLGGIYATHMRTEGNGILGAIDETIRISREAKIPVEIWHLKVAGKQNWGRMPEVIARINAARAQGVDLAADTYAYTAWGNGLASFIPPWAHDGGDAKLISRLKDPETRARIRKDILTVSNDWQNEWLDLPGPGAILIGAVQNPKLLSLQGKTLAQIADLEKKEPLDALFDLLIDDNAFTTAISFGMSEPDVALALQQPWVSIDNDYEGISPEGPLSKDFAHPRAYGTWSRLGTLASRTLSPLTAQSPSRVNRVSICLPISSRLFSTRTTRKNPCKYVTIIEAVTSAGKSDGSSPDRFARFSCSANCRSNPAICSFT